MAYNFKETIEKGGYYKCLGALVHNDSELESLKPALEDVYNGKNIKLWREALRALTKPLNAFAQEKEKLLDSTESDLYTFWLRFVWWRRGCGYKLNQELLAMVDDPDRKDEFTINCPKCGEPNYFREPKGRDGNSHDTE